jgi:class 3 adenylate cyclase
VTSVGHLRWRERLDVHDELARRRVEEFRSQLVKTTGDGILATFDGPGRGSRCAAAFQHELRSVGVQVRAGLHTGDIGGVGAHIAARVMASAVARSSEQGRRAHHEQRH